MQPLRKTIHKMNDTLVWDMSKKNDPNNCIDIDPETLYSLEHTEELEEVV